MRRALAALLLVLAAGAWYLLVAPARRARDTARAEYAQARQQRERLRARLAELQRLRPTAVTPGDAAAAGRALRLVLVRATAGLKVEAVQVSATGEARGAAARGRLSAEGRLADLLRVAERLYQDESGFRIERIRLTDAGADDRTRRLEIEGLRGRTGS